MENYYVIAACGDNPAFTTLYLMYDEVYGGFRWTRSFGHARQFTYFQVREELQKFRDLENADQTFRQLATDAFPQSSGVIRSVLIEFTIVDQVRLN